MKERKDNFYRMDLSGQRYDFVITPSAAIWGKRFAKVLRLRKHSTQIKTGLNVFVIKSKRDTKSPLVYLNKKWRKKLSIRKWKADNLGAIRLWHAPKTSIIICDLTNPLQEINPEEKTPLDIIQMWYLVDILYRQVLNKGGLPLHAALLERNRQGFVLAAPSNKGKSTSCGRLSPPWQAFCDDETLVVNDGKQYRAHPFPTWSNYVNKRTLHPGKNRRIETSLPIRAVFFLIQACDDAVEKVNPAQAAVLVTEASLQVLRRSLRYLKVEKSRTIKKTIFANACKMVKKIPAYFLYSSLTGKFWENIELVCQLDK